MALPVLVERPSRLGLDPVDRVFKVENHDQAYHIWRDAGVKQRILVHIDAHHDMWWIPDLKPLTIANFICPALRKDLVRQVYWVVPDGTWETATGRKAVLRHVEKIVKKYPGRVGSPKIENNQISTLVLGKPLTVCSLSSLPEIAEDVLLDIDVDFLIIPAVTHGESDRHEPLPWCWPDDLLGQLRDRNLRTDLVTIAYSVEGGYTPLKWKYLGDELALRLRQPGDRSPIRGMRLMREAAQEAHKGEPAAAEVKYQQAKKLLATCPSPDYHLAHLCAETGRMIEAQTLYGQALAKDASYRTAYNCAGLPYYWDRRFRDAEREFRRILTLDREDAHAHLGLGRLAARRRRWTEAETLLRKSLSLDNNLVDSHRELGEVLVKRRRYGEAAEAYEQSLRLVMAGHKPLSELIASDDEQVRVLDQGHSRAHARLAHIRALQGRTKEAINGYRMSLGLGHDSALLRSRLARLYVKQKAWQDAALHTWQAFRLIPAHLRKALRGIRYRFRMAIRAMAVSAETL
jgi:tetratricopeptide (TPR) repeat protein